MALTGYPIPTRDYVPAVGDDVVVIIIGDTLADRPTTAPAGSKFVDLATGAEYHSLGASGWINAGVGGSKGGFILKTANESRANTVTMADDSTLLFAVDAASAYAFRAKLFIDHPATGDFKWQVAGPGDVSKFRAWGQSEASNSGTTSFYWNAMGTAEAVTGSASGFGFSMVEGNFVTVSAGTFSIQWAQNTLDAGNNTTLREGSWLEWMKA